jgi:hypothetical protein
MSSQMFFGSRLTSFCCKLWSSADLIIAGLNCISRNILKPGWRSLQKIFLHSLVCFSIYLNNVHIFPWKLMDITKQSIAISAPRHAVSDANCEIYNDQYSETNVMHFLFNLLRIKGLYVFRALLAHPQETLQKRHLVCCVRVMSVGSKPGSSNIPSAVCVAPPDDEQVMLETCRGP